MVRRVRVVVEGAMVRCGRQGALVVVLVVVVRVVLVVGGVVRVVVRGVREPVVVVVAQIAAHIRVARSSRGRR